jgi:hypothetical protein
MVESQSIVWTVYWIVFMLRLASLSLAFLVLVLRPGRADMVLEPVLNDPWSSYQWAIEDDRHCRQGLGIRGAWRRLGWPEHAPGDRHPVHIAIIDTGLNSGGSDCRGQIAPRALERTRSELGGIGNWSVGFVQTGLAPGGIDCHGHGTALGSIIGATGGNQEGIAGLLWPIAILACQAAPGGVAEPWRIAACLRWVSGLIDAGLRVPVVNLSLQDTRRDAEVERALRELRLRGVLAVTAAGNDPVDNDSASDRSHPASYAISNVIAVAGVDRHGELYMSRRGRRTVHVAAPGRDVPALDPGSTEMRLMQGTSPAAAYVTGLVALLAAEDPTRDWRALRNLVLAGGIPVASLAETTVTGRRICASARGGLGSMTCRGQRIVRRLNPVEDAVMTSAQRAVSLRVLSIDCAATIDPGALLITDVATGATQSLPGLLRDDGGGADEAAGDGEWTGQWQPHRAGNYVLRVSGEESSVLRVEARM